MNRSALLVIDMQKYFLEPGAPAYLKGAPSIIPNILKLIERFRKKSCLIIFTRHAHKKHSDTGRMGKWWDNKLPWVGDPFSEFIDSISTKRGEICLTKTLYSAFEGTNLASRLKRKKIDRIYICGVMTNLCVETTARHAFMKGFEPVIIEDACAANTLRHHKASILNLSYGFAKITKTRNL